VGFILHVERVVSLDCVYDNLLWQLYCESVLVDRNLLDVIAAPDLHAGFCHEVLDDYVRHKLSVCVSFLVEAMNTLEGNFKVAHSAIVATCEHTFGAWVDGGCPDPVLHFSNFAQLDALFVPQSNLLVTASNHKVLSR